MTIPTITVAPNFTGMDASQLTLQFGNGESIPIVPASPIMTSEPTSLLLLSSGFLGLAAWRNVAEGNCLRPLRTASEERTDAKITTPLGTTGFFGT